MFIDDILLYSQCVGSESNKKAGISITKPFRYSADLENDSENGGLHMSIRRQFLSFHLGFIMYNY